MYRDFQNRLAIAAHSDVEVFAPTGDDQPVGRNTGSWWPYRYQRFNVASRDTRDRCLKYLVDHRGAADQFGPPDFMASVQSELNATHALPRPLPGAYRRDPAGITLDILGDGDVSQSPTTAVLPVEEPYDVVPPWLYDRFEPLHQAPAIAPISLHRYPPRKQVDMLRTLREAGGWELNIWLVDIVPRQSLIRALAEHPALVDAILLPRRVIHLFETSREQSVGELSDLGEQALAPSLDPSVRAAAELSYFLSPLCERAALSQTSLTGKDPLDSSVFPDDEATIETVDDTIIAP